MKKVTRFTAGLVFGALVSAGALALVPAPAEALPPVCGIVEVNCQQCAVCDGTILSCHGNSAGC